MLRGTLDCSCKTRPAKNHTSPKTLRCRQPTEANRVRSSFSPHPPFPERDRIKPAEAQSARRRRVSCLTLPFLELIHTQIHIIRTRANPPERGRVQSPGNLPNRPVYKKGGGKSCSGADLPRGHVKRAGEGCTLRDHRGNPRGHPVQPAAAQEPQLMQEPFQWLSGEFIGRTPAWHSEGLRCVSR